MKNVYLTGFMGTGKTVVGKILAKELNKDFIDMDEAIVQNEGKKIADIFASEGEFHFRKVEKELLKELSTKRDLMVSCGGGLICDEENLNVLRESGTIVNLQASPEVIYERIKETTRRPLLNVDSPLEKIKVLLNKRQFYYSQAHYCLDTNEITPEAVAEKIIAILKVEQ
ncbi:MAG: shikimate kinase [Candidatus Omnitrophica bacterium]|nr:shikimate kinase [Candidatus Omnitrophota bacterium]MBU0878625.1 shikimate kinase [Candidatus Omnitrophota bacterium]MBU0896835.1 shikimate kinase [Candidatus Omnitrophota bacterium]MBU1133316.1 shikimate kinase [Candidatus Omnitrophota bacterium]MBU1811166.1 shikimate kinase [Candidatus Omnitrophota bacterium]